MPVNLSRIESALTHFSSKELRTAATDLLSALGYSSQRIIRLEEPSAKGFIESFRPKPEDFNAEKALTDQWEKFEFVFQLTDNEVRRTLSLFNQVESGEKNSFFFHALQLAERDKPYTRTELGDITRQLNKPFGIPTVVLIRHGGLLTIGVIARRGHKRDTSRDKLGKVSLIKDIDLDSPHPAHLRILAELSLERLPAWNFKEVLACWQNALDIRELNSRFYKELSAWYNIATARIQLPVHAPYHASAAENVQHFTVRLICRTLFCWFLKEKGLIDRRLLELYDLRDEPTDLLPGVRSPEFAAQNSYYRGVLQNVFFASLNQPMGTARAAAYLGKRYLPADFDYGLFGRIPYLNGGLFDKLEEDNANDVIADGPLRVPNELFYAEELTAGSGRSQIRTQGLNRILNNYKFTVAESTAFEEEVALDPELLGLVFENLLAETDPDEKTAKNARKASGSFYTPRPVIEYMVNESLVLYLISYAERNGRAADDVAATVKDLIYHDRLPADDPDFAELVVNAFDDLKILDPACGSGAFPMGMLNRVVHLLRLVDPGNRLWVEKQLRRLPAELRDTTRRDYEKHDFNYARKLGLIRNAIYGLDILPMASVITKLRFFISLLIEQEVDLSAPASNYNISALPNLETKIVCANTLKNIEPLWFDEATIDRLEAAREQYYDRKRTAFEKSRIADQLAEYLDALYPYELFGYAIRKQKIDDAPSKRLANRELLREWFQHGNLAAPFFNLAAFFPELRQRGFDIVIGNPPYGGTPIPDDVKTSLGLQSKDPYGAFISRFLGDGVRATPLRDGGVLAFIVSDAFMTLGQDIPLRRQMIRHYLRKMIRVHRDTFHAMVNTAIIFVQKRENRGVKDVLPDDHTVLMADLTKISIHEQHEDFLKILHKTAVSSKSYSSSMPSSEYAIHEYSQNIISANDNLPFFVASPNLFALTGNKDFATSENTTLPKLSRDIIFNGKPLKLFYLGDSYTGRGQNKYWLNSGLFKIVSGIKTGNNSKYLGITAICSERGFPVIDEKHTLSDSEAVNLDAYQKANGIVGEESWIGFEMGASSDSSEGWLPCYYLPDAGILIDWSASSVQSMKAERHSDLANKEFRFLELENQISFSTTGLNAPTFRLATGVVFLNKASRLFLRKNTDILEWVGILNSKLIRYLAKNYSNHTVEFGVDDLKSIQVISHIEGISALVSQIIAKQKADPRYDYASHEQVEIDRLVYEAYGLSEEDIAEVETWYARRYAKLAEAQARNLAALAASSGGEAIEPETES